MALATRVLALLEQLTREDIEALSPAERQRLAQLLRHLAGFADPPPAPGVLRDLGREPRDC
jgi:hypothetical protein